MPRFLIPLLFACTLSATAASADTITVCLDGGCDHTDIQAAIDAASDGDVIEIAEGTYLPAATIDTFGKAVTLRGTVDKAGNPTTIIDGQNSFRVFQCSSGEDIDTVFENLWITGGSAQNGGGMYCLTSCPTLDTCVFQQNSATDDGGAIYCNNDSNPNLTNCIFLDNFTIDEDGGGMSCTLNSSPILNGCMFEANEAKGDGGGLYSNDGSNPSLTNCIFRNNKSEEEGGGMFCINNSPTLSGCTFVMNTAENDGGGIYCNDSANPTLNNCEFRNNSATTYDGGGMSCTLNSSPSLTSCVFEGNSATRNADNLYCQDNSNPVLTNCTFTECCEVYPTVGYIDNGGNLFAGQPHVACEDCRADVNCDGIVDSADLGLILSGWGSDITQYDVDGDGLVQGGDLGYLLGSWGVCAP